MNELEHLLQAGDLSTRYLLGHGLLERTGEFLCQVGIDHCVVVTDSNVARYHRPALEKGLGDLCGGWIVLAPGEEQKSLRTASRLYDRLLEFGCDRRSAVVAFGGGVIGDLAGFVAATYMRGVALLQVPTTLLAMVDSSIGAKVGVDLAAGKNLVGAFHAPVQVLAEVDTLRTLPRHEWASGMAEVIKHAVIRSPRLFQRLEGIGADPGGWSREELAELVYEAAGIKIEVVSRDPREGGERVHLNFGHTLGHALEAADGYRGLSHGAAVSIGMMAALGLSSRLGLLEEDFGTRLVGLLCQWGLPVNIPSRLKWESVEAALRRDKKNVQGRLAFVLARALGRVELVRGVDPAVVRAVFQGLAA